VTHLPQPRRCPRCIRQTGVCFPLRHLRGGRNHPKEGNTLALLTGCPASRGVVLRLPPDARDTRLPPSAARPAACFAPLLASTIQRARSQPACASSRWCCHLRVSAHADWLPFRAPPGGNCSPPLLALPGCRFHPFPGFHSSSSTSSRPFQVVLPPCPSDAPEHCCPLTPSGWSRHVLGSLRRAPLASLHLDRRRGSRSTASSSAQPVLTPCRSSFLRRFRRRSLTTPHAVRLAASPSG
jgi:hypothetical protein